MAQQTVLFTVMPRGVQVNPVRPGVSVFVSPRLEGASTLDAFPDWLNWTGILKDQGLRLTFRIGSKTITMPIQQKVLEPRLWKAMFNESTFVRSHTFQDYTDRTIFSYPVRLALSTIKAIYQEAGLTLGLPDRGGQAGEKDRYPRRQALKGLLEGMEVNWDERTGNDLRDDYRKMFGISHQMSGYEPEWLAPDGTLSILHDQSKATQRDLRQFVAQRFSVYSHMPQGAPIHDNPPNFDKLIDFHQALSSLNSYPELLHALGLVLDFDLPVNFVLPTGDGETGLISVVDLPEKKWQIDTLAVPDQKPPLETAYLYFTVGSGANESKIFTTAPGILDKELPRQELEIFGLVNLDPTRYGLAQVDVESGMHKTIMLAEIWQDGHLQPSFPDHPDVFDETTTLSSLRSGGLSVYADNRSLHLLQSFTDNKDFNTALTNGTSMKRPFYAEDLVHGYRLDIWDSFTNTWHSLHLRNADYKIGEESYTPPEPVEGFLQLAAAQAAPDPHNPTPNDLYLNESIARWMGWSLSVPFPGKVLSRDPDPDNALKEDPDHPANEPATPFKMSTLFRAAEKSLPALRFGRRYRVRMRAVDISGNSLKVEDPLASVLSLLAGLPRDPEGTPYLRYEPVAAPLVVLRDKHGITDPGSQLNRLVIHTYNSDSSKDADPADLTASDRFITPPPTSVEIGERLGMFDKDGKLDASPSMYELIGKRDQGKLNYVETEIAGQQQSFPLESGETIDELPYLPDVLSRGAALRDLPGAPDYTQARVTPGAGAGAPVPYAPLDAANPRDGSAVLVSFGGNGDWQKLQPFRLALADGNQPPVWDPAGRVLTVSLPKGTQSVVPLSSYLHPEDLKLMGIWQWLREYIDYITARLPDLPEAASHMDAERIAHLLQRAVEGGHWMITPPTLLTLVHAVQQPVGTPAFTAIAAQHVPYGKMNQYGQVDEKMNPDPNVLQTAPEDSPTAPSELSAITAWRKVNAPDAYLLGGLQIHAASTEKVDLLAEWSDPIDDISQPRKAGKTYRETHTAQVDAIEIPSTQEGYLGTGAPNSRKQAFYDADHDMLCFARNGDRLGNLYSGRIITGDAAPRHYFNDTHYHRVTYTARATSRYREYFPQDQGLDFRRDSLPMAVDVPASARPAAPLVDYVIPTFGWQRQSQTNLKRSVRFGGGLRVYLDRPWFSSGDGELLGVLTYDISRNGSIGDDRELWKPYVTQWGADPIWTADPLVTLPQTYHFLNPQAVETHLSLPGKVPGPVNVVGYPVDFDYERQQWFADLTLDTDTAYMPFIRLVFARYQPFALVDAKLSPAVLADYIQITPERSAVVTADPYHPRSLRLTVSGPAPSGPAPVIAGRLKPTEPVHVPTLVVVTLQRRDPHLESDLAWEDAPVGTAVISQTTVNNPSALLRWTGTITFAAAPNPGQYRILIREYEYLSANYTIVTQTRRGRPIRREQPSRLIYAETIDVDSALIGAPGGETGTQLP